jgi:carbonic anhydrase
VYDINDGVLKDLQVNEDVVTELEHIYGTKAMEYAEKEVAKVHGAKPTTDKGAGDSKNTNDAPAEKNENSMQKAS